MYHQFDMNKVKHLYNLKHLLLSFRKIGVKGQRRQTITYTFHRLHKKVTPPPYKGRY